MTEPTVMNDYLYRALEWIITNPDSSAKQIADSIGCFHQDRFIFALLDRAAYKGLCQRNRTGNGPWLWEVPAGAPLADYGGPPR